MLRLLSSCLVLLPALAGCRSVQVGLQEHEAELATRHAAQAQALVDRRPRLLDWPSALVMMQAQNLSLQEARDAVVTAEERLRQINRDLIPGAALTGNLTKALTDLGDLRGSDAALSIYGFFNVPGVIQWRVRHYAAELQLLRAHWALELKSRELTIQLRELFVRNQLLTQRRRQLALAQRWQISDPLALSLEASPPKIEHESLLRSLRLEEENLQDALAGILGDSSARWEPLADYLPRFDYAVSRPDPQDTGRFGGLYRRLHAAELEGARLRQRGVLLQYWPDLHVNLSSPPLYQSQGGRDWSPDFILLNLGATVQLDLRGSISQQLRETRRDFARLEARLREQNARATSSLLQARESLQLNARQLRLAELRLEALRSLPPGLSPARARENLERLLALDQQRTALLVEQTRLEALFWILDETRWPAPAT
jgi:hypothetical protein